MHGSGRCKTGDKDDFMHSGVDPLLSQPRPSDHCVGDALGDEHSVATGQVLAAWSCTGHDKVLHKSKKTRLLRGDKLHPVFKVMIAFLSLRQMSQSSLTQKDCRES